MNLLQPGALADGTPQEFPLSASYNTEQLFCKVTQGDHSVPLKHNSSGVTEAAEEAEGRNTRRVTRLQTADGGEFGHSGPNNIHD